MQFPNRHQMNPKKSSDRWNLPEYKTYTLKYFGRANEVGRISGHYGNVAERLFGSAAIYKNVGC